MSKHTKYLFVGEIGLLASVCLVIAAPAIYPILCERFRPEPRFSRIHSLSEGAEVWNQQRGFYPGQEDIDDWLGRYSGSQILAAHLFGYGDDYASIDAGSMDPTGMYARYEPDMLAAVNGRERVLVDDHDEPMAICYYIFEDPPTADVDRLFQQNAVHTGGTPDDLRRLLETLRRPGDPPPPPWGGLRFLLVSPGEDRVYFTDDDASNW